MKRLLLGVSLIACATACASSREQSGGTNTNWLMRCSDDVDCGEGSCRCGLCTLECAADADCGAIAAAQCLSTETLDCGATEAQVCARTCSDASDCEGVTAATCEGSVCVANVATKDAGSSVAEDFAPSKGPAHGQTVPVPGGAYRYLNDDDTWRYVAPENPGRLYDAVYFDGQYFVLHGVVESSEKAVTSETSWLSSTHDGVSWETLTLTTEPFESYTRLASNGKSLLLAGTRHVAMLADDGVDVIAQLDQDTAPVVMIPHAEGYVLGRRDDVLWLGLDRSITQVYAQELAQFHSGMYADGTFLLFGPFGAVRSSDGQSWTPLSEPPCPGCLLASGAAHGNGIFVVADLDTLFTSSDGERWQAHVFDRAVPDPSAPPDGQGEDRIARVDFTAQHFTLLTDGGNTSLSDDAVSWSPQLKIPLGQIGPAPCDGRCIVAGGRVLLPPAVVPDAVPPMDADTASPYYCAFGETPPDACLDCGGATVADCREGVICRRSCESDADCPAPNDGDARVACSQTQLGGECMLFCDAGERCPSGMTCSGGNCFYVFDDPPCTAGAP